MICVCSICVSQFCASFDIMLKNRTKQYIQLGFPESLEKWQVLHLLGKWLEWVKNLKVYFTEFTFNIHFLWRSNSSQSRFFLLQITCFLTGTKYFYQFQKKKNSDRILIISTQPQPLVCLPLMSTDFDKWLTCNLIDRSGNFRHSW